jgi:hypothetical protein
VLPEGAYVDDLLIRKCPAGTCPGRTLVWPAGADLRSYPAVAYRSDTGR